MKTMTSNQKGYSADEVKTLAETKGLPCQISDSGGIAVISPLSTLQELGLVRIWSRFMTTEDAADDTFEMIERAK